jgi:hypothetical protein
VQTLTNSSGLRSGRGGDHDACAVSHLPAVQAGVLLDTWAMNLRHTPWWLIIVGCTLPFAGTGCTSSGKASSSDASISTDAPTSTGGSARGGAPGTGGGFAGSSGNGGSGTTPGGAGGRGGTTATGGATGAGGVPSVGGTTGKGGTMGTGGTASTGCTSSSDCPTGWTCAMQQCWAPVKGGAGGGGSGGTGGTGSPVCPGFAPRPADTPVCRTVSDCPAPYNDCSRGPAEDSCADYCVPGATSNCANCGTGNVCEAFSVPCCDSAGWACIPACTATSCPADQHCAASGRCEATVCTAGYTCPSGARCPADARANTWDVHGCTPVLCTEGYVCPSYATCQPGIDIADVHGCVNVTCTGQTCPSNSICTLDIFGRYGCRAKPCSTDHDCDCGVCIGAGATKGSCAGRINICRILSGAGGAQGSQGGASGGGGGGAGGVIGSGGRGLDSGGAMDGA